MRVTDNMMSSLLMRQIQTNLGRMAQLQGMAASGVRIQAYADDPAGLSAVRRYQTLLGQNAQYQRNIGQARAFVTATDGALQSLNDVLARASELALRESSGGASPESMRYAATEIDALLDQALAAANAEIDGRYLFAGFRTDMAPFIGGLGPAQYRGDSGELRLGIGPSTEMVLNIPGEDLLGSGAAVLGGRADLAPRLRPGDDLAAIGLGAGWEAGSLIFVDASGVQKTLDLTGAGTVQDVLDLLNAAGLDASIAPDGASLRVADPAGGPLAISDPLGGGTARSLGLLGSGDDGVIDGADIRTAAAWTTPLADIDALDGNVPLGRVRLEIAGTGLDLDLSSATTLGDVRTAFEAAAAAFGLPPLSVDLRGGSLVLSSDTGEPFRIVALSGDPTATLLGIVGEGVPTDLFGTLEELQAALLAGDVGRVQDSVARLDSVRNNVLELEVAVGGKESLLDWMDGLLAERDDQLQVRISSIRDVDITQVASDLSQAEAAYQAGLTVAGRLYQMNLFDYLR